MGLEHISLAHLKRARKTKAGITVLLSSLQLNPFPPLLPPEMDTIDVYQLKVPAYPAITVASMKVKQLIWPVVYAPPRRYGPEEWTTGEVKWATAIMKQIAACALANREKNDVRSDLFRTLGR